MNAPKFKVGDRVKLSAEGLKIKELNSVGLRVNPIWKKAQGTITGQPMCHKAPHLFTVQWDHIKTKQVFDRWFLELSVLKLHHKKPKGVSKGTMVKIDAALIEFVEGGQTIWVHGPEGATILRIKTMGKITSRSECENVCSHLDIQVQEDINICLVDKDVPK